MKDMLISIQPPHTTDIFDCKKKIEWRTKQLPTGKHYVYETKKCFGLGEVIGEFHIWRIKRYESVDMIPENHIELGCVPIEFLEAYSKGKPLYAHFIIDPKRYDKPVPLRRFHKPCPYKLPDGSRMDVPCPCGKYTHNFDEESGLIYCTRRMERPPQSWCYVEEVKNADT